MTMDMKVAPKLSWDPYSVKLTDFKDITETKLDGKFFKSTSMKEFEEGNKSQSGVKYNFYNYDKNFKNKSHKEQQKILKDIGSDITKYYKEKYGLDIVVDLNYYNAGPGSTETNPKIEGAIFTISNTKLKPGYEGGFY